MGRVLFFCFLSFGIFVFAQEKQIFGNVQNEDGIRIPGVMIVNSQTGEKFSSASNGDFYLNNTSDETFKFIKEGYEIKTVLLNMKEKKQPVVITLIKMPTEIEEVNIAYQPTGDLKKDLPHYQTNKKTEQLNADLRLSLKNKPSEVLPKTAQKPSLFQNHDYNSGQVSIFALIGTVVNLVKKAKNPPPSKPNYEQLQAFYHRIKSSIDISYFYKYGMDDYDFERFLVFAEKDQDLYKKFANNFNAETINSLLKTVLRDYLKSHPVSGKPQNG